MQDPRLTLRNRTRAAVLGTALATVAAAGLTTGLTCLPGAAQAGETPSPAGARVYIINLKDGDTVKSPFLMQFGLSGMGVAPAGTEKENTGHHHLIVDTIVEGEEIDQPIYSDEQHIHFGGGQTEAMVTLPAGQHTLQLVLGDHNHVPHDPPVMSERISVTVE